MSDGEAPYQDANTLHRLRVEEGKTLAEIADELECGRQTVANWIENHEIGYNVECPSCDEMFENRVALERHHTQAHDARLGVREVECEWCGTAKTVVRANAETYSRHFCDEKDCQARWQEVHFSGDGNPAWNGGWVEAECEWCGERKEIPPAWLKKQGNTFCSESCEFAWRSENHSGPKSPNWLGGNVEYYGPNWLSQRRKARERDGHECQDCGMQNSEHIEEWGEKLHVHHITRFRAFDSYEEANQLSNLVTLCRDCHLGKWEKLSPLRPDSRQAT